MRIGPLLGWLLLLLTAPVAAHEIPADVTVPVFIKPQDHVLRVLVRLPLRSSLDAEYPRRERDFVDLARAEPSLRDAAGVLSSNLEIYEDGQPLPAPRVASVRMSLDSDKSFASYEQALAHVTGPRLPDTTTIFWEQGLLDVLFEYPIRSDASRFSLNAHFDRFALKTLVPLQFLPPGTASRAFALEGDAGLVHLEPTWFQAAANFVRMGFLHILEGIDHLLFLLCLIIPFRRVGPLIAIVTAFTVAHSITLMSAAFNLAPDAPWFPPLIEVLIATSVFYMALENIAVRNPRRRWIITFLFGLVHGFGFSFGLQHTLQFAGTHLLTSLFAFNIGVEIGQVLVLLILVPLLNLLFRHVVAERTGIIILSALVAHTAWHWMGERFDILAQFPWPTVTAEGLASMLGWLFALVAIMAGLWLLTLLPKGWARSLTDWSRQAP